MESGHEPRPRPADLKRLGRYRIVRPLSKGGMALVYEARRESLAGVSPRVAIKLILPEHAESDTFQELFINEARLGAAMHHQNLVQIQDFDRDGDNFFLVMEYVEGITLRRVISLCSRNQIPLPMGVIAEIGRQACDGLDYAHRARDEHGRHLGLVHRDMKPSNLILNPQGVVKILDFGISKGALLRERRGAVRGTWGYMAPEQAAGGEVGSSTDVFGLGIVLTELALQRPMFKTKGSDEIKALLADDHAARMAATLDPSYGPLIRVLVRALQRDPKARYDSAAELGRALSALLPDPITARDEVTRFYRVVEALGEGRKVPASVLQSRMSQEIPPSQDASIAASAAVTTDDPPAGWIVAGVAGVTIGGIALIGTAMAVVLVSQLISPRVDPPQDPLPAVIDAPALDEPPGPAGVGAPGEEIGPPPALRTAAPDEPRALPSGSVAPPPEPVVPPRFPPRAIGAAPSQSDRLRELVDEVASADPEDPPAKVVIVREKQIDPVEPVIEVAPVEEQPPDRPAAAGMGHLTVSASPGGIVYDVFVDGEFVKRGPFVRREFQAGRRLVTITATDGRIKRFEVDLEEGSEVRRVWDFDRGQWRR